MFLFTKRGFVIRLLERENVVDYFSVSAEHSKWGVEKALNPPTLSIFVSNCFSYQFNAKGVCFNKWNQRGCKMYLKKLLIEYFSVSTKWTRKHILNRTSFCSVLLNDVFWFELCYLYSYTLYAMKLLFVNFCFQIKLGNTWCVEWINL